MKTRKEFDSIGYINVPVDKYWGASTERSKKTPLGGIADMDFFSPSKDIDALKDLSIWNYLFYYK